MAQTDIFVDVETGVILDGFDSTLRAPAQSFTYGDTLDLNVTGVRRNQGVDSADTPWSVIDMTAKNFRVAIGTTDRLPFDGAFTINASDSIDHDALAPAVETALNADATITAEGGVTVTGLAAGGWRVTFVTDGAKTALAGNVNTLLPSSNIYLDLQRAGDTNVREVWMLRIETIPSAYAQLVADIPAPIVEISQVRNGSIASGISEVQAVTMTGTATGGTYALTLGGVATGEISHNADDIEIQEAIALLPIVGGDIDLITVTGDARAFTVSFDSTLGDLSAMTVDDSNLIGLTGKRGEFNLNTLEIIELLNGKQSNTGFFEIVLYDTDNSQGETVSLSSVSVVQDIIPDSPPSVTPVVEYADKIHTHLISDVTGLQTNLTSIENNVDAIEARDWVALSDNVYDYTAGPSLYPIGTKYVMGVTTSIGYPCANGVLITETRRADNANYIVQTLNCIDGGDLIIRTRKGLLAGDTWTAWQKAIQSTDGVIADGLEFASTTLTAPNLVSTAPDSLVTRSDLTALYTHGVEDYSSTDASFSPAAGARTKVLNNGLGSATNTAYKIPGRGDVWDTSTSEFDFLAAGLVLGDTVTIRLDFELTTTSANDGFKIELDLGTGVNLYTLTLADQYYRFSGTNNFTIISEIYMGDANTLDNPGTIYITPDAAGSTIQYNGHYVKYSLRIPSID